MNLSTKRMIFNSFIPANDYSFGAQMTKRPSRFLDDNKTFEGICLARAGTFREKEW